jgi:hypothetical protein
MARGVRGLFMPYRNLTANRVHVPTLPGKRSNGSPLAPKIKTSLAYWENSAA